MEKLTLEQYEADIAKTLIEIDKYLTDVYIITGSGHEFDEPLKRARIKLIKDHQQRYLLSQHSGI